MNRPNGSRPVRLSQVRPQWTYRVRDVFVTESAPAYAFAGALHPSTYLPPHTHEFIEIIVVTRGRGSHLGASGTVILEPGTVVVVRPGAWHAFGEEQDVHVATLGISPSGLSTDLAFLRARPSTRDLLYAGPISGSARGIWVTEIPVAKAEEVYREVSRLSDGLESRPQDVLFLLGQLIAVLGIIASGMAASEVREAVHPAVAATLDRLDRAPERAWSVAELAAAASLDEAYLTRLFRAHVGVPPIAYLARVRAERAANLLTVTALPVSSVGARVGWADPTYFARRFQSLIGLSPTEYRRRMRVESTSDDPVA
jgi:AraC family L-rhamnose operon transcriptional activator RhaR